MSLFKHLVQIQLYNLKSLTLQLWPSTSGQLTVDSRFRSTMSKVKTRFL